MCIYLKYIKNKLIKKKKLESISVALIVLKYR